MSDSDVTFLKTRTGPRASSQPAVLVGRPATAPLSFHVMAKPTGAICNLDCRYCFYLTKEALYPGHRFRMSKEVLETYIRQIIESQTASAVTIAWQGGEPTLMGLDFFRRAVELAESYRRRGQRLEHTLQTNGTLLTDEWARFLKEHDFLVGLSVDGPRELHDAYRVDKHGKATFDKVTRGMSHLLRHGVRLNVLCTVHFANASHPIEVYRFLRDYCAAQFIQFIPIVERSKVDGAHLDGRAVSDRSVTPGQWGDFLIAVFDEWVRRDVGAVFVQMFDGALASWLGAPATICVFAETCGNALVIEHNGDVYSCDHFVDAKHLLGNITQTNVVEIVASAEQRRFGEGKRDTLPGHCLNCDIRFACNGECPKNRFALTPDGEEGLNYLCVGYKAFFHHIDGSMKLMVDLLRRRRYAEDIMRVFATADRNESCPCGNGRKAKACHGR